MKKFVKIIKKIKIRHILILIVLLAFNSYAWFIYATKVSAGFDVHVSSWNVGFEADNEEITSDLDFDVTTAYPGMEDYSKELSVRNRGEVSAVLSYSIKSIRIFTTEYTIDDKTTAEDLQRIIDTSFPFEIVIETSNETIEAKTGQATFKISMIWPLDSGNDNLDTYWGNQAYVFANTHPDESSIHIEIEIKALQG